mmetsp:Transcript_17790/g.60028  ORF Transcript_17790/g.60028 Transcript_17790/m.60028 type:complete len:502 (-) Transcript_17790:3225-4730(-)
MIFDQSLSTLENFLASTGSCFAMSPPVKTDSREHHMSWTLIHLSKVSEASLSAASLDCVSSRKGATWRMVSMVCSAICASSSSSIKPPVACKVGTGRDFQSRKENSRICQMASISARSFSIFNCFSAPSVTSSTSSLNFSSLSLSTSSRANSGAVWSKFEPVSSLTSSQCRGMTEGLESSWISGSTMRKSSIWPLSRLYASYCRSRAGIFLHRSENCSMVWDMSLMLSTTEVKAMDFQSSRRSLTSVKRPKSWSKSKTSFFVWSRSGYCVNGSAKSSSPPRAMSNLREHWASLSFANRSRSNAFSGSTPGTPGPACSQSSRSLPTSLFSALMSFFSRFLCTCCLADSSSARFAAVRTSFLQLDRSTVLRSTSVFSMKPGGRLCSSMAYISMMGRTSASMPDSRSRTCLKRSIMPRRASRSSSRTTFSSLTDVDRMYSDSDSSLEHACWCRLSLYVTFQSWHSALSCCLRPFVLSDSAPMLCTDGIWSMFRSTREKLRSCDS